MFDREEAAAEGLQGLEDYLESEGTCENCGGQINGDDDGCSKFRMMQVAK